MLGRDLFSFVLNTVGVSGAVEEQDILLRKLYRKHELASYKRSYSSIECSTCIRLSLINESILTEVCGVPNPGTTTPAKVEVHVVPSRAVALSRLGAMIGCTSGSVQQRTVESGSGKLIYLEGRARRNGTPQPEGIHTTRSRRTRYVSCQF